MTAADILITKPITPMAYDIIVSETAENDLRKFDSSIQKRFFDRVGKLKDYPKVYGKPLRRPLQGKWELRFERRWRIVYEVNDEEKIVKIVAIWHKDEF